MAQWLPEKGTIKYHKISLLNLPGSLHGLLPFAPSQSGRNLFGHLNHVRLRLSLLEVMNGSFEARRALGGFFLPAIHDEGVPRVPKHWCRVDL